MLGLKKNRTKKIAEFPLHVKTGDTVMVISGKDKGKTGIVKKVFPERGKVLVENVNIITKAMRSNPMAGVQGGLVKMEAPIAASKVMLFDHENNKPTRVRHTVLENGKKTRVSVHGDVQFDK